MLFHTDQGSQCISSEFRKYIDSQPIIQSLSNPGYLWDNVVVEVFLYMKKEELHIKLDMLKPNKMKDHL